MKNDVNDIGYINHFVFRFGDPLHENENQTAVLSTSYECEVCSQVFSSKKGFLEHHVNENGEKFTCCKCEASFKTCTELYQHYDEHKIETTDVIIEEDVEFDYSENVEAVMNIPGEETSELLYILDDDAQCVNEVVIDEGGAGEKEITKSENYTIVQVEHGYMIPSVFKGQLEGGKRLKKDEPGTVVIATENDNDQETVVVTAAKPTTSRKLSYVAQARRLQPKRRHEVPDFSAANYLILNPNDDVDMVHYKCLRCEQLFINKFVFFRHIEKGKCYVNACDVCNATFNKNSEFYEHYLVEHTDRAICNFCFRTFMYEKNVKEHMLRHLDQFRHRCEECNKGFYTVREYRNHYKNRHMGIRHKCEICGRSFADEYYFKRHIATHAKANSNMMATIA